MKEKRRTRRLPPEKKRRNQINIAFRDDELVQLEAYCDKIGIDREIPLPAAVRIILMRAMEE